MLVRAAMWGLRGSIGLDVCLPDDRRPLRVLGLQVLEERLLFHRPGFGALLRGLEQMIEGEKITQIIEGNRRSKR